MAMPPMNRGGTPVEQQTVHPTGASLFGGVSPAAPTPLPPFMTSALPPYVGGAMPMFPAGYSYYPFGNTGTMDFRSMVAMDRSEQGMVLMAPPFDAPNFSNFGFQFPFGVGQFPFPSLPPPARDSSGMGTNSSFAPLVASEGGGSTPSTAPANTARRCRSEIQGRPNNTKLPAYASTTAAVSSDWPARSTKSGSAHVVVPLPNAAEAGALRGIVATRQPVNAAGVVNVSGPGLVDGVAPRRCSGGSAGTAGKQRLPSTTAAQAQLKQEAFQANGREVASATAAVPPAAATAAGGRTGGNGDCFVVVNTDAAALHLPPSSAPLTGTLSNQAVPLIFDGSVGGSRLVDAETGQGVFAPPTNHA